MPSSWSFPAGATAGGTWQSWHRGTSTSSSATSWLNERGIPFLSFSSLDVRSRGVAEEMLALLAFLDSPPDDLSFATFILGRIFAETIRERNGAADAAPLHGAALPVADRPTPVQGVPGTVSRALEGMLCRPVPRRGIPAPVRPGERSVRAVFRVRARAGRRKPPSRSSSRPSRISRGPAAGACGSSWHRRAARGGSGPSQVPPGVNSVQAMTVHKAKGLGFPVVIALFYGGSGHSAAAGLLPDEDGTPRLVRVTAALAKHDASIQALRESEELRQTVDRMNALYVALTRARRELYVIGVRREGDSFPFDLLPEEGFAPRDDKGPVVHARDAVEACDQALARPASREGFLRTRATQQGGAAARRARPPHARAGRGRAARPGGGAAGGGRARGAGSAGGHGSGFRLGAGAPARWSTARGLPASSLPPKGAASSSSRISAAPRAVSPAWTASSWTPVP